MRIRVLSILLLIAAFRAAPSAPIELIIPPLDKPPTLDGRIDAAEWNAAATLAPFQRFGATAGPTQQTQARIGFDNAALYVAFRCAEEQTGLLRTSSSQRDTSQWEDDCVELFLDVDGTRQRSFQLIVSANNTHYDSRVSPGGDSNKNDPTWNPEWQSATRTGDREWSAEIRIPFASLGVPTPSDATRWTVNFSRHRTPSPPESSTWSFCGPKGFSDFAAMIDARFGAAGIGKTFAGIAAPPVATIAIASQSSPTLIPSMRKEIKRSELGGVAAQPPARKGDIPIVVSRPEGLTGVASWPVRVGVPFPRGALTDAGRVQLVDSKRRAVPIQTKILGTWDNGGSVRWLLVNFDAQEGHRYTLRFGKSIRPSRAKPAQPVTVTENAKSIHVATGNLKLEVSRERNTLIDQLWWKGAPLLRPDGNHGAWLTDQHGVAFHAARDAKNYRVEVEQAGPLRAVIKASSWFADDKGNKLNQTISRIHVTAGQPIVQVQHTFVLTEGGKTRQFKNISVSLPLADETRDGKRLVAESAPYDSFREGLRKGIELKSATFSMSQLTNRKATILDGDNPIADQNECAGGWVDASGKAGGVALVAKWFSQNFPNEIEMSKAGDLTYHFWSPRFGHRLDLRPKPWLTARGNYQIWHQQIVPMVRESKRVHELPVEDGGTMDADGLGVAKTHEFALILHDADDASIPSRALAFQDPVYAFADPKWMTETEVFQRSLPHGDPQFAQTDAALDAVVARMISDQRDDKMYEPLYGSSLGIFDFGDDLHQAKYCHRYFSHHFYCSPTMPWHLYFRSGDRAARRLAEANSFHRMDVDTCHYTADPNSKYRAGAWNHDDGGIIHWAWFSVTHESTSNYGPHLAYLHYLTGDERALDVAREVTDALKWVEQRDRLRSFVHRGTGMALWNIVELWVLTGDPDLKRFADHYVNEHVKAVRSGFALGYYPEDPADFTLSYVAPAMIRYHMMTGDARVAQWIVNQAGLLAEAHRAIAGSGFSHWDLLAYAQQLTGDGRYVVAADHSRENLLRAMERDGMAEHLRNNSFIGFRVWWMYQAPMLLAALKNNGSSVADLPRANDLATQGDILVLNETGKPIQVNVAVGLPRGDIKPVEAAVREGGLAVVLRNPRGEIVSRSPYPAGAVFDKWFFRGPWIAKLADEKSPQRGIYRVELESSVPDARLLLKPVESTAPKIMSRVVPDGHSNGGQRYFAFVPKGAAKFGIKLEFRGVTGTWGPIMYSRILDPEGREAARMDVAARQSEVRRTRQPVWSEFAVEVPAGMDGRPWQVQLPGYDPELKFEMIGSAPYVAATVETCFDASAVAAP